VEKELKSQADYAKEGLSFYRKNESDHNPFVLSLGVNVIEMQLKAIVEEEMGYIPKEITRHSISNVCNYINHLNIPHFQIPYDFLQDCQLVQRYYTGGRYFDANNRQNNIFSDYDFELVGQVVARSERLLERYLIEHEKAVLVMNEQWNEHEPILDQE